MKPIVLKGHTKPVKDLMFNKDGDFLFSASNDRYVTLWASETGERIGTYYHNAAVYNMSITLDSKILVTGDSTGGCYFWEVNTGALLKKIAVDVTFSIKSVELSYGDEFLAMTYGGRTKDSKSYIDFFKLNDILGAKEDKDKIISVSPFKKIVAEKASSKFSNSKWMNLNKGILTGTEDGWIQLFDFESGEVIRQAQVHKAPIMDLDISRKEEVIMTASKDGKAHVIDPDTFNIIRTMNPLPERNINTCKFSPLFSIGDENEERYHAIVAGGQESRDVAGSQSKGGFELLLYNVMYGEELGSIQGHFSPVNTIAFSPDGKIMSSGAEEGSIRVHKLDEEYMNLGR